MLVSVWTFQVVFKVTVKILFKNTNEEELKEAHKRRENESILEAERSKAIINQPIGKSNNF